MEEFCHQVIGRKNQDFNKLVHENQIIHFNTQK